MKNNKNYGFFTTISMIIGIVIGSGIIFKTANVLRATQGNVLLGVMVIIVASFSIIFGSLTLSQLALRTEEHGGVISYVKASYGKKASGVFGWFISLIYMPTITAVLAWVSAVYLLMFLNVNTTLEVQIVLSILILILLSLLNILSAKASGYFQNVTTAIKLVPLIIIAIIGFFYTSESGILTHTITSRPLSGNGLMFLTAIGPISFIFDGWTIATTVSGEIKNPKKTLPIALTIAPIIILIVYVAYFIGITRIINPSEIMSLGNDYIYVAFNRLVGNVGSKIALFILVISMLGTTNGLILGSSRSINYLANEDLIMKSHKIKSSSDKIPVRGIIVSSFIALCWLIIHYGTLKFNLLDNADISEISIAMMYLLLICLYVKVIQLKVQHEIKGCFKGYIFPFLAIIGSLIMFSGSLQNQYFIFYFTFSVLILLASYVYVREKS